MGYRDEHYISMPFLSPEGKIMEEQLKKLADRYGYRKLPKALSMEKRSFYMEKLASFWRDREYRKYQIVITTHGGTVLADGVTPRGFVCGDYGVFLEIDETQIHREALTVQPGEEYRINDPAFKDKVKYEWYTDKEGNGIKMYHQLRGVTYADYKAGMWYVSPYEVTALITGIRETEILADNDTANISYQESLFDVDM